MVTAVRITLRSSRGQGVGGAGGAGGGGNGTIRTFVSSTTLKCPSQSFRESTAATTLLATTQGVAIASRNRITPNDAARPLANTSSLRLCPRQHRVVVRPGKV